MSQFALNPRGQPEDYEALVQALAAGRAFDRLFEVELKDTPIGRRILTAKAPEQRLIVQAMLKWLNQPSGPQFARGPGVCARP